MEHAAVVEHADELLGVQRIPAGAFEQGLLGLGGEHGLLEQRREEPGDVLVRQRGKRDRRRVPLSATPPRVRFIELGAGGADHHDRCFCGPHEQIFEEFHECVVRPMQVLDDHDQRLNRSQILEEAAPRREGLGSVPALHFTFCTNQGAELSGEPVPVGSVFGERLQSRRQFPLGDLRAVGLADPSLTLDDLAERPKRDPFAVRKTAALAPPHDLRLIVDPQEEFVDQA